MLSQWGHVQTYHIGRRVQVCFPDASFIVRIHLFFGCTVSCAICLIYKETGLDRTDRLSPRGHPYLIDISYSQDKLCVGWSDAP